MDSAGLALTERILLAPVGDSPESPFLLHSVTTDKDGPLQVLTNIRYTALVQGEGEYRYAWYVYKDGRLYSCRWYSNGGQYDFVPTRPGKYFIRAWAVDAAGRYSEAVSAEMDVTSPVTIVIPDLKWRAPLSPMTEPVVKLVQHHMAQPQWDIYGVHNYHLTRTYTKDDGTTEYWSGIGYNYWIGFDGTIYEGRGRMLGAHAGAAWNHRTLGVGYQGDFETQAMTDAQLLSGAWLNAILLVEDNLSVNDIIGHGDISTSLCPGQNFRMAELKSEILKLLPPEYLETK
jgi:hypothetical protein